MAAKTGPAYKMSNTHRDKIKNSNILNALIEHVDGKRKMSATQVNAGLGLLKKIMPDLAHQELSGPDGGPIAFRRAEELSDDELAAVISETSGD